MDLLGIGPLELLFIILIALIVLGPRDMVKAGRNLGRFLRRIATSQEWRTVQQASREFRHLPNKLMRDAGLEEIQDNLNKQLSDISQINTNIKNDINKAQSGLSPWTTPPPKDTSNSPSQGLSDRTIQPPPHSPPSEDPNQS